VRAAIDLNKVVAQPDRQAMTTTARVNWSVHIIVRDEAQRLGTVQAQTHGIAPVDVELAKEALPALSH
jgi:hypothetical protein